MSLRIVIGELLLWSMSIIQLPSGVKRLQSIAQTFEARHDEKLNYRIRYTVRSWKVQLITKQYLLLHRQHLAQLTQ